MLYEEHIHWQRGDVFTWDQINHNFSWNIKSKTICFKLSMIKKNISAKIISLGPIALISICPYVFKYLWWVFPVDSDNGIRLKGICYIV